MPIGAFRTGFTGAVAAVGGEEPAQFYYQATDYSDGTAYHYIDGFTNNLSGDNKYMTLSLLLKFGSQNGYNRTFDLGVGPPDSSENPPRIFSWINPNNGTVYARFRGTSATEYQLQTSSGWDDDNWHLFTFVFDGDSSANSVVYVDGSDDTGATKIHTGNNITWSSFDEFGLGVDYDRVSSDFDFNGELAYVWIDNSVQSYDKFWDSTNSRPYDMGTNGVHNTTRPLVYFYGDTSTITENGGRSDYSISLNTNGSPGDTIDAIEVTGFDRDQVAITAKGNAQVDTAQSKFGNASLLLDGVNDYLEHDTSEFASTLSSNDFTIEGWIKTTTTTTSVIYDAGTTSTFNGPRIFLWSAGYMRAYWNGSYVVTGSTTINDGSWHHFAVVRNGSTLELYIDGTSEGSGSISGNVVWRDLSRMGVNYGTSQDFNGSIDEFRISSTARYTSDFTEPSSAFTNDTDTLLLIHADGTDGSTDFYDDNGS